MAEDFENLHMDSASVAGALEELDFRGALAHLNAVANTGVQSPANAAYTQADQTAIATCVKALVVALNTLNAELVTAGIEL